MTSTTLIKVKLQNYKNVFNKTSNHCLPALKIGRSFTAKYNYFVKQSVQVPGDLALNVALKIRPITKYSTQIQQNLKSKKKEEISGWVKIIYYRN